MNFCIVRCAAKVGCLQPSAPYSCLLYCYDLYCPELHTLQPKGGEQTKFGSKLECFRKKKRRHSIKTCLFQFADDCYCNPLYLEPILLALNVYQLDGVININEKYVCETYFIHKHSLLVITWNKVQRSSIDQFLNAEMSLSQKFMFTL